MKKRPAGMGAGRDQCAPASELVFDQPGVAAAIVGTINPLHLAHNVAMAANLKRPEPYIGCNIRGLAYPRCVSLPCSSRTSRILPLPPSRLRWPVHRT